MKEQRIEIDGRSLKVRSMKIGSDVWVHVGGRTYVVSAEVKKKSVAGAQGVIDDGEVLSPMPGKILKLNVRVGEAVTVNQVLVVMEAMKMEYSLTAKISGKMKSIKVKEGEQVELNQLLVEVEKI